MITPQSIAQVLIGKRDNSAAIDFTHPSLEDARKRWGVKSGYYLYDSGDVPNTEHQDYLKLIIKICLKHLNHLQDVDFINRQIMEQIKRLDWTPKLNTDSLEGFDRIYNKNYKSNNFSFCFCMILVLWMRGSVSSIGPWQSNYFDSSWVHGNDNNRYVDKNRFNNFELHPITKNNFLSSTYQVTVISDEEVYSINNILYFWTIEAISTNLNFYASRLLHLLIAVGDSESISSLMSNPLFVAQDVISLAQTIELAISSGNYSLLTLLTRLLQKIEPKHPAIELANSQLRKFELYAKSTYSIDEIGKMSGIDFEFALRSALLKHAHFESVQSTPASGDYGADLILTTKNGSRIAVQCKRFSSKVNLKAVQEVVAAIKHYGCDLGVVISNNGFLQSAHELAKSNEVELWDGEAVLKIFAGEFDFSEVFSV